MLSSAAIGILVNFHSIPIWITGIAIIFYISLIISTLRNQKSMNIVANKQIEIDKYKILIRAKEGKMLESIKLGSENLIKIKKKYSMAQETMSDLKEEIKGNTEKHFLILVKDGNERRLDFEINSYYMLTQLSKVIEQWQKGDYKIQYL